MILDSTGAWQSQQIFECALINKQTFCFKKNTENVSAKQWNVYICECNLSTRYIRQLILHFVFMVSLGLFSGWVGSCNSHLKLNSLRLLSLNSYRLLPKKKRFYCSYCHFNLESFEWQCDSIDMWIRAFFANVNNQKGVDTKMEK